MAHPTSSEQYSSHISSADDSISSGTYPSAADHARYPNLYPTTKEVIYSSQRGSQPAETSPASSNSCWTAHPELTTTCAPLPPPSSAWSAPLSPTSGWPSSETLSKSSRNSFASAKRKLVTATRNTFDGSEVSKITSA